MKQKRVKYYNINEAKRNRCKPQWWNITRE